MASRAGARQGKKIYQKMREVCELLQVPPYMLRYWEKEFPFLAPERSRSGQRIYTDADIQMALRIKALLSDEGYTTAGARRRLAQEIASGAFPGAALPPDAVAETPAPTRRPAAVPLVETPDADEVPHAAPSRSARKSAAPEEDSEELRDALRALRVQVEDLRSLLAASARPLDADASGRPPLVEDDDDPPRPRPSRRPGLPRRGH